MTTTPPHRRASDIDWMDPTNPHLRNLKAYARHRKALKRLRQTLPGDLAALFREGISKADLARVSGLSWKTVDRTLRSWVKNTEEHGRG